MYFVYLIQSLRNEKYYIGQTNNIDNRLNYHNSGYVKSTKNSTPWRLVGFEKYATRSEARYREYQIKNHSDQKKKFINKVLNEKNK